MHILFADESGTPPKPGKERPSYFVAAGAIIPEAIWHRLKDAILGMKIRRKIRGELKWRYFAPGNDDLKNPLRKLAQPERDDIRKEMYGILCAERSVRTIAAVCSIRGAYNMASVNTQEEVYQLTYKILTERFQYYLQDCLRDTGREEYGIIVCDHRGGDEDKALRAYHQKLLYSGAAHTSKYSNLVEGLFLQPSNLSIGIQFADMVAGAVWRKFERNDSRWYDLIEPSFRRGSKGQIAGYGIIKVPKSGWV